jgi:L-threonylcarbamoyladenylate synthase
MAPGAAVLDWGEVGALVTIAAKLARGEVIALPTETLYGFSCRALDPEAVGRIQRLKRIEARRGFVALVASAAGVERHLAAAQEERSLAFLRSVWPAPLTAVLAVDTALPWSERHGTEHTAAFRVPASARLRELLANLGEPVLSTSANRSGEPPCRSAAEIVAEFGAEIDLVVRDADLERAAGERVASSLADCTAWPPRLLRAGKYDLESAIAAWEGA